MGKIRRRKKHFRLCSTLPGETKAKFKTVNNVMCFLFAELFALKAKAVGATLSESFLVFV